MTIPAHKLTSARITADAWGVAYIGITRGTGHAAGGQWWVTRSQDNRHWSGQPTVWAARMAEDGTVSLLDERFKV